MQVSATSRHCERNGWGGRLRKSENITKQVHQWAEAIESIPLAKLGNGCSDFLLCQWPSVMLFLIKCRTIVHQIEDNPPRLRNELCVFSPANYIFQGGDSPGFVVSWLPGQNYVVRLIMYRLGPCFDFISSSWYQSVDGSCNNGRSAEAASFRVCRVLWTYKGKRHGATGSGGRGRSGRGKEEGISQGVASVVLAETWRRKQKAMITLWNPAFEEVPWGMRWASKMVLGGRVGGGVNGTIDPDCMNHKKTNPELDLHVHCCL